MELHIVQNHVTCHGCENAVSAGDVRCKLDGRGLGTHAEAGYCPDEPPRYGDGVKPEGWASIDLPAADPPARKPAEPVPRADWPLSIKALALLAQPGDTGIGDVAHRVLAGMGADALAKLYEQATGRDCGCGDRQQRLNALYPLKFDGD